MDKSDLQSNLIDDKILFDGSVNSEEIKMVADALSEEYEAGIKYEKELNKHKNKQ